MSFINKEDEERAIRFFESHGLQPKRYPGKDSKRLKKTPDFTVSASNGYFFYCEQKSVLAITGNDGILHSTINNNLTDNIHEAAKQFKEVNSKHLVPNVLVWFSHNCQINDQTLRDLLNGRIEFNGKQLANLLKFRHGRIGHDLEEIDLHIWLYPWGEPIYVFTPYFKVDTLTVVKLCRIFDINNVSQP